MNMVYMGLEKSLKKHHVLEKSWKIEKLWDGLEKSLNFPQKSLNIFESSSFVKKKHVLRRGMIEKNSNTQFFFGYHESVFL